MFLHLKRSFFLGISATVLLYFIGGIDINQQITYQRFKEISYSIRGINNTYSQLYQLLHGEYTNRFLEQFQNRSRRSIQKLSKKKESKKYNVTDTQILRQKLIENVCKMYNNLNDNRPLKEKTQRMFTEDKRHLMYCYITKVANTNWKRGLLLSSGKVTASKLTKLAIGKKNYDPLNPSMFVQTKDFMRRFNFYYPNTESSLKNEDIENYLKTYFKFVFVRNPYTRLLSAYRDIYEYEKPKQFRRKFYYKTMGVTIIKMFRKNASMWSLKHGRDVTFEEFLRYIIFQHKNNKEFNEHYEPMWHMCNPCRLRFNFIGKMETLAEDADYVLRHIGATTGFEEFPTPNLSPSSIRSNMNTSRALLSFYSKIPPDVIEGIKKVYKYDFELFGYSTKLPLS